MHFGTKGDRDVALRPEMTQRCAHGRRAGAALKKPIRWFSIATVSLRAPARGRLRAFSANMDIIGEAGPLADAELMAAAIDIMRAFGLGPKDVQLARLRPPRIGDCCWAGGWTEAHAAAAFAVIDRS